MIKMQEIMDVFVDRIQGFIVEKNWNITKFSDFISVPRRTVNSWMLKQRTPRIDLLYHIADCLNVTIDYLVGREQ